MLVVVLPPTPDEVEVPETKADKLPVEKISFDPALYNRKLIGDLIQMYLALKEANRRLRAVGQSRDEVRAEAIERGVDVLDDLPERQ